MKPLVKLVVILVVLGGLGVLFVRSAMDTRREPFTIESRWLRGWTFAIEPATAPGAALVALHPPRELASSLFRQLFTRAAESMNGPHQPYVPLLLQDEFNRSFAGRRTSGELLALARESGIEGSAFTPRCMGYRRESAPGVTRQVYFVVFEAPAFASFRQRIAAEAIPDSGFAPAALSPVMIVAASDPQFDRWLPLQVNHEADCIAPIDTE